MELQRKWDECYRNQPQQPPAAANVLERSRCLLPQQGRALDLACGLGGNALLLAEAGLQVEAWDISAIALQALQKNAAERRLAITVRQCRIAPEMLPKAAFDVIVISRFLDRTLCNAIMAALDFGGLLFYQTFTRRKLDPQGPNNPDYLLAENELLSLFPALTLIFYQEYARVGDLNCGDRNEAQFIGQKPLPE
ncbi:MAG: class I SAM-dependent methyltransferase [Methylococcales bacterium]|nr:class I SAM-dependent methyltransferase [Methylococcales bacterium]